MITKQEIKEHIEGYCKELRLPAIRHSFEEDAREADLNNYAYEEFLYYLLLLALVFWRGAGVLAWLRLAGFPS